MTDHFPRTNRIVKNAAINQKAQIIQARIEARFAKAGIELYPRERFKSVVIDQRNGWLRTTTDCTCATFEECPLSHRYMLMGIPLSCIEGNHASDEYLAYYITHELCHAAMVTERRFTEHHNKRFYEIFKQVATDDMIDREIDYKPSAAAYLRPEATRNPT